MTDQDRPNGQPTQDLVTGEAGSAFRPPASEPAVRQLDAILENTTGSELASDLRRETAVAKSGTGNPPLEPVEQTSAEAEAGLPPR